MAANIEHLVRRVPSWQNEKDLSYSPLGGGITNQNFKIDTGTGSYVLRVAGTNTGMLGIDRQNEYAASKMAGDLNIAPEVIYFIEPEGYLVTRFISGKPLPPEQVKQAGNLEKITSMLKEFHAADPVPGTFWVPQIVKDYTEIARQHEIIFPENFPWLLECLADAEKALAADPLPHCPCHNDLLNENFLVEAGRIFILDWEYAGMGDRFFDLANLSVNHDFTDEEDQLLLKHYFGEISEPSWAHLKVMRIISDYRESMWGMAQMGISELDFDFRQYADNHFERLTNNLQDPHWNEWLEIISRSHRQN
jgi:thiamine kinase-like enzyme